MNLQRPSLSNRPRVEADGGGGMWSRRLGGLSAPNGPRPSGGRTATLGGVSEPRPWLIRPVIRVVVGVGVLVVFLIGVVFDAGGTNGTKQAELGTTVLGGVIVGGALLLAQLAMSRDADRRESQRETQLAMSASQEPIPAADTRPPTW